MNIDTDLISLENYPVEVLVKIFIFVAPNKDSLNLELICRHFLSVSRDEFVWEERYKYHFGWSNKPININWKQWCLQTSRWLKSTNLLFPIRNFGYTMEDYQKIWKLAKVIAHDDLISWCIKGTSILCNGKSPYVYSGELIPLLNSADLPETMRTLFNQTKNNISMFKDHKSSYSYHLESCVKFDRTECLKVLINEIEMNVNHLLSSQETPISVACKFLNIKCIETLCTLGADVNIKDQNGFTPLMNVVSRHGRHESRLQIIKILLKYGANPNAVNPHNNTPIILASQHGHVDCVKKLIKKGANLEIMNDHCKTALCCSLSSKGANNLQCSEELIRSGSKFYGGEIYHAVSSNSLPNILLLIRSIPKIHSLINNFVQGITPLMLAMKLSNAEIGEVLLKNGAEVNIVDSRGCTAVSYLSPFIHSDKCLTLLNEFSASFNVLPTHFSIDPSSSTLLLYYINMRSIKMISSLLECDQVDINQPNEKGETPIFKAVQSRDREITLLLLENGANINHVDHNGVSCLMNACSVYHSSKKMISLLLYHGADPYLRDHSNQSAVDHTKNEQVIQLLIENWSHSEMTLKNFSPQMCFLKLYYNDSFVSKYLR